MKLTYNEIFSVCFLNLFGEVFIFFVYLSPGFFWGFFSC